MPNTVPSHFESKLECKKVVNASIADLFFYDKFVVVEIKEGITLSYTTGFSLLVKGLKILGSKPWIYVSHRVNSYAVVPTDYKYLNKVPTLKGLAIINPEDSKEKNVTLEKEFFKKPFKSFHSFEDAYYWGLEILEKN